jgi:hypothetical protein
MTLAAAPHQSGMVTFQLGKLMSVSPLSSPGLPSLSKNQYAESSTLRRFSLSYEQTILITPIQPRKESLLWAFACPFHTRRNSDIYPSMNRKIGSSDILSPKTPVRVGNRRGFVKKCETVPASNGGFISLHTVVFNEKAKILTCGKKTWEKMNPVESEVNYSFILF